MKGQKEQTIQKTQTKQKIQMEQRKPENSGMLRVGIDVGSTTTKVVAFRENSEELLLSDYTRHHSDQL